MADTTTHDQTFEFEDMIDFLSDVELYALADAMVNEYLVVPESWNPFLAILYCVGRELQGLPSVVVQPKQVGMSLLRIVVANLDQHWLQRQYELVVESGGIVDLPEFDRGGFGALVEENQAEALAQLLLKPLEKNVPDNLPELEESKAPRLRPTRRCFHQRTSKS